MVSFGERKLLWILKHPRKRLGWSILWGVGSACLLCSGPAKAEPQTSPAKARRPSIITVPKGPVFPPKENPLNDFNALHNLWKLRNLESPSLFSVLQNAEILAKSPQSPDYPSTYVSLYRNGAVVSRVFTQQKICKNGQLVISHLSSAVDPSSFIFCPPEGATVLEYGFEPHKTSTTSAEFCPQTLVLDVQDADNLKKNALWKIQYALNGISWKADHAVELSADQRHILFSTILTVQNRSGIDFKDAELQFFECALPCPKGEAEGESVGTESRGVYRYERRTGLPANQERRLLWTQARHVALSTRRGLFVGGDFLQKMEAPAAPLLENALSFPNVRGVGLGIPLPEGRVTVYHQKDGFVSRIGVTALSPVPIGSDVTIRLPASAHSQQDDALEAQLVQESYRELNAMLAEAEYRLIVKNLQADSVPLSITVDARKGVKYSVVRSNVRFDTNKNGEAVWNVEIPAQSSREIRYKLTLKTG